MIFMLPLRGAKSSMAKILFLAHRLPIPPNKGDKIRAYHILTHLAARHDVWLGTCADEAIDLADLSAARKMCKDIYCGNLNSLRRGANMLVGAIATVPLSVARFHHGGLGRWIDKVLDTVLPDYVYVFSSAMAQYVLGRMKANARLIVDFVDADAEKWRQYSAQAAPPMRWLYDAEFRRLVRYDTRVLVAAQAGLVVSETERRLLTGFVPEGTRKLQVIANGVATDFFRPGSVEPAEDKNMIVFTGRMDYAPNVDAVRWFARDIFPLVRASCPDATFVVVGASPVKRVRELSVIRGVRITGAVADVRPYLFGASAIVAPLRIARGIQNKVLEGMAAARPLIVTPQALDGIDAHIGRDVLVATDTESFAARVCDVLLERAPKELGGAARSFVLAKYQWSEKMRDIDALMAEPSHVHSP